MERLAVRNLIKVDNGILLGKRNGSVECGKYCLIGGKVDPGETLEQAALREALEETGLNLNNLHYWAEETNDKTKPGEIWHTYYFIGEGDMNIKLNLDENSEVVVVDRRNYKNYEITFGHRDVLEEFFGLR